MSETSMTAAMDLLFDDIERGINQLQRRIAEMSVERAANPDGDFDRTAQMLALKRGCRR